MYLLSQIDNLVSRTKYNEKIKKLSDTVLGYLIKYRILVISILVLGCNPAFFAEIIENSFSINWALWGLVPLIAIVFLNISINTVLKEKGICFYLIMFLALMLRNSFLLDYKGNATVIIGVSLLSILVLKRKCVYLIPFVCLACEYHYSGFINEYLPVVLVLTVLENGDDIKFPDLSGENIITYICSFVVYMLGVAVSMGRAAESFANSCMAWQYYDDYYHFGFVTRGFVATIRYIILGDKGSIDATIAFIIAMHLIGTVLICLVLLVFMRKYGRDNLYVRLLLFAYICSESFRNLGNGDMFIYYDGFMIMLTLVCLLLMCIKKFEMLIPLIILIAMLIHHGYGIFLFPVVFVMLIYRCMTKGDKENNKMWLVLLCSLVLVVALFGYFHFAANAERKITYHDACKYLSESLDLDIYKNGDELTDAELRDSKLFFTNVDYVLYGGKLNNYGVQEINVRGLINSVYLWIVKSPFVVLIFANFRKMISRDNRLRTVAKVAPFSLLILLFAYLEVDYGRWNGFFLFSCIFALLIPIIIDEEQSWINSVDEKYRIIICKAMLILMILIPDMGRWAL